MDGILSFFSVIGDAIVAAFDFVIDFFADVVYVISLVGKALGTIPGYLAWLPAELIALLLILISVVVVYKILGREG